MITLGTFTLAEIVFSEKNTFTKEQLAQLIGAFSSLPSDKYAEEIKFIKTCAKDFVNNDGELKVCSMTRVFVDRSLRTHLSTLRKYSEKYHSYHVDKHALLKQLDEPVRAIDAVDDDLFNNCDDLNYTSFSAVYCRDNHMIVFFAKNMAYFDLRHIARLLRADPNKLFTASGRKQCVCSTTGGKLRYLIRAYLLVEVISLGGHFNNRLVQALLDEAKNKNTEQLSDEEEPDDDSDQGEESDSESEQEEELVIEDDRDNKNHVLSPEYMILKLKQDHELKMKELDIAYAKYKLDHKYRLAQLDSSNK